MVQRNRDVGSASEEVRSVTFQYIGARERWERRAEKTIRPAIASGHIRQARSQVEAGYERLLSAYFAPEAVRGAKPNWSSPPSVDLSRTAIVDVRVSGERAVVETREVTMDSLSTFQYHLAARDGTWLITDRRWKDDMDGTWIAGVY